MGVAAFDVDGTLTVRDCVGPFLSRLRGRRALVAASFDKEVAKGVIARDRDAVKEVLVGRIARGLHESELDAAGLRTCEQMLAGWLRRDVVGRLRQHQRNGDQVVLVSASFGSYLRHFGEALGVDAVLCTDLEVGNDGLCTGRFAGPNCRGPEKLARLNRWAEAEGLPSEGWLTDAYGDSSGDREMLAAARTAHWVKRREVQ